LRKPIRRTLGTSALIGLGMAGFAVTAPASAAASTLPGVLVVCSLGDHSASVVLPGRDWTSEVTKPRSCTSYETGGKYDQPVDVYADDTYVGSTVYNASDGLTVFITGEGDFRTE
jgi:hypothetical protein